MGLAENDLAHPIQMQLEQLFNVETALVASQFHMFRRYFKLTKMDFLRSSVELRPFELAPCFLLK